MWVEGEDVWSALKTGLQYNDNGELLSKTNKLSGPDRLWGAVWNVESEQQIKDRLNSGRR